MTKHTESDGSEERAKNEQKGSKSKMRRKTAIRKLEKPNQKG
jgi:hypothetical protein